MRFNGILHSALLASAALVLCAPAADARPAYTVLHQFTGASGDGAYSYSDVALDDAGNLYGTTHNGGAHDVGAIYKLTPDGSETLVHSFVLGDNNGYNPYGGVTVDRATGDLYGTTEFGGASDAGVIWKLAANGTYSLLHTFDDTSDGRQPRWHLVQDHKGNFYGVALFGGSGGDGTVFKLAPDGTFTVLHSFTGSDGNNPVGRLERDRTGNLYGVTFLGGAHNWGSVYKIAADGTFSTVYSFTNGSDGGFPEGGMQRDKDGNLYGTTAGGAAGYGTLFKLAPNGSLTTLYTFHDGKDGGAPFGDLLRTKSGKLYGTTSMSSVGDCQNGCGTVFAFTPGGKFKTLYRFMGGTTDGGQLDAGLTEGKDGTLYGATPYYGTAGDGVVFSLTKK
ncbi:MAG TPA: choice-of-anchor tandem repeat GloVer-containing protein [Rhizomicrobium sp.]|jgi:uncharacterized repeat protein (TIGR03803 family)|nr:choice-of-anchor tandem repeat GloVer-containing protein [Rhizomicrobium sp.]